MVDTRMLLMIFFINFAYITLNPLRFYVNNEGEPSDCPISQHGRDHDLYSPGLSLVLDRLDNPLNLFVYALRLCCWDQRWHS